MGLKQPRGDEERYVTPARAAAKETICSPVHARLPAVGRKRLEAKVTRAGILVTLWW